MTNVFEGLRFVGPTFQHHRMLRHLRAIFAALLISVLLGSCGQGGGSGEPEAAPSTEPDDVASAPSAEPSPEPEPAETLGGPETGLLITLPEGFHEVDPERERERAPRLDDVEGLFYLSIARMAGDVDGALMMVDPGARGHLFSSIISAQCKARDEAPPELDLESITSSTDLKAVLKADLDALFGDAQVKATSIDGYMAARGESQLSFTVDAGKLSLGYVTYMIVTDDKVCSAEFFTRDASDAGPFDEIATTIDVL